MIRFRAYNVLVPKVKIEELVEGGLPRVYKTFRTWDAQEDEYLVGIGAENATEVRNCFEELLKLGLRFNENDDTSEDFAVMAKEGIWWPVPCLVYNDEGCWFIADVQAPV